MQIDPKQVLKGLAGKQYETPDKEPLTLGMVVAEALGTSPVAGKMKSYVLAQKFWNDEKIELDAADVTLVRNAIESCTSYNNLVLGQALVLLEASK